MKDRLILALRLHIEPSGKSRFLNRSLTIERLKNLERPRNLLKFRFGYGFISGIVSWLVLFSLLGFGIYAGVLDRKNLDTAITGMITVIMVFPFISVVPVLIPRYMQILVDIYARKTSEKERNPETVMGLLAELIRPYIDFLIKYRDFFGSLISVAAGFAAIPAIQFALYSLFLDKEFLKLSKSFLLFSPFIMNNLGRIIGIVLSMYVALYILYFCALYLSISWFALPIGHRTYIPLLAIVSVVLFLLWTNYDVWTYLRIIVLLLTLFIAAGTILWTKCPGCSKSLLRRNVPDSVLMDGCPFCGEPLLPESLLMKC